MYHNSPRESDVLSRRVSPYKRGTDQEQDD